MSAGEFRHYGRAVVDWIADRFERVEQLPVLAPKDLENLVTSERNRS
jgi:aromatic-L-amino-acid decarboxylase